MDGFAIVYTVQLFGGLVLVAVGAVWALKHPRAKGEPLTGRRRTMMMTLLLGTLLVINGIFGFLRP